MARHNREGRGLDQHGDLWVVSYQPDWLRWVRISRELPGGRRRSTLTLFRNPSRRARERPGRLVRTRIEAVDGSAGFQISLEDGQDLVDRVVVEVKKSRGKVIERIRFVLQGGLPGPP
ncbi:MAG: hypothetical protein ACE5HP_07190 [Gemmatimonadota bacterium]